MLVIAPFVEFDTIYVLARSVLGVEDNLFAATGKCCEKKVRIQQIRRSDKELIGEVTGLDHATYYGLQVWIITGLISTIQAVKLGFWLMVSEL